MYDFCECEDENTHFRLEGGSFNLAWEQKHEHPWNTHSEGVYLNKGAVGIGLTEDDGDRMDTDESRI
jgi:hypothetical protein